MNKEIRNIVKTIKSKNSFLKCVGLPPCFTRISNTKPSPCNVCHTTHAGETILEANLENDAYDAKDPARAIINGDVNVQGTFVRVEDG